MTNKETIINALSQSGFVTAEHLRELLQCRPERLRQLISYLRKDGYKIVCDKSYETVYSLIGHFDESQAKNRHLVDDVIAILKTGDQWSTIEIAEMLKIDYMDAASVVRRAVEKLGKVKRTRTTIWQFVK
jgi:biotin operon repressor